MQLLLKGCILSLRMAAITEQINTHIFSNFSVKNLKNNSRPTNSGDLEISQYPGTQETLK